MIIIVACPVIRGQRARVRGSQRGYDHQMLMMVMMLVIMMVFIAVIMLVIMMVFIAVMMVVVVMVVFTATTVLATFWQQDRCAIRNL